MTEYNVRFKNTSSDDVKYTAVHALAHVQGHLDVNENDDYTGPNTLFAGPRVVTFFSTFPPAVLFSEVIDINHDYFKITVTDSGINKAWGNGGF